jgi:UDP-2,3-diacylglucosamine hydrolase
MYSKLRKEHRIMNMPHRPEQEERHYFVSDTHFCMARPTHISAFKAFSEGIRSHDKLILLGDIFEVWIGDDTAGTVELDIEQCLSALTNRGVEVFFMHGNRDFLVGKDFAARTACTLINDPSIWTLPNGAPCLLTHGDMFCTHNKSYKRFRAITRNKFIQWLFLRLPKKRRMAIASSLRSASKNSQQNTANMLLDAHEPLVCKLLEQHPTITTVIMGLCGIFIIRCSFRSLLYILAQRSMPDLKAGSLND